MALVQRNDPYGAYNFLVVVNDISEDGEAVTGAFMEASGLEVELSPIDYRNGNEDIVVRKIPGLKKFTNITLKRGVIGHAGFWDWVKEGLDGKAHRTSGSVILLDEARDEVMRWNFKRAWPCKWTGPGLKAAANEIATETLEICHEGVELET